MDESIQGDQPPQKKKRSANYDFKDLQVLVQLAAKLDPDRLISSSNKDAGTIAKKRVIWDKIVKVRRKIKCHSSVEVIAWEFIIYNQISPL